MLCHVKGVSDSQTNSPQSSMMTMWCFELRRISDGSTYSARNIRTTIRAKVTRIIVTTLLETYDHNDKNENDNDDNDDEMLLSTVAIAEPDWSPSSFSAAKVSGGLKYMANQETRQTNKYDDHWSWLSNDWFEIENRFFWSARQQPSVWQGVSTAISFQVNRMR